LGLGFVQSAVTFASGSLPLRLCRVYSSSKPWNNVYTVPSICFTIVVSKPDLKGTDRAARTGTPISITFSLHPQISTLLAKCPRMGCTLPKRQVQSLALTQLLAPHTHGCRGALFAMHSISPRYYGFAGALHSSQEAVKAPDRCTRSQCVGDSFSCSHRCTSTNEAEMVRTICCTDCGPLVCTLRQSSECDVTTRMYMVTFPFGTQAKHTAT
jgi:hypothetical protein